MSQCRLSLGIGGWNREGGGVSDVLLRHVGSIDLLDLRVIGEFQGWDGLPFPFMFTKPTRFATENAAFAYSISVPDRFKHGDLSVFGACIAAYVQADIRVECHVQYIPADTPSVRVMAYRTGDSGYFMTQLPDADVVDVYTVSPYDLGAAVSDAVALTQPGRHPKIVIPKFAARPAANFDTNGYHGGSFVIRDEVVSPAEVAIAATDVSAYSTVQSHWRPARNWGLDHRKPFARWVRVNDDGDYVDAPDHTFATPMSKPALTTEINRLIADDIADLREFRGD
jgi:hypothetical protein